MTTLLHVAGLNAGYGSSRVLRNISLDIAPGSVVCVMGRNGAGKTTLLRALMGVIPKQGSVVLHGSDIARWSSHRISRAGMAWVPQEDSVFPGLTVREHLTVACRHQEVDAAITAAAKLFPVLGDRLDQEAQTLSGGERKMLAIAQALEAGPNLILMDEPTEGVAPVVVQDLITAIRVAARSAAIVLVEQNVDTAVAVGAYAYILERGQIVESGAINELHEDGVLEERLGL